MAGNAEEEKGFKKYIDKPDAPEYINVTIEDEDNVFVTWDPPPNDGGSPVTEYLIRYRSEDTHVWQQRSSTSEEITLCISDLLEGNSFLFEVAAVNNQGRGDFTETYTVCPCCQIMYTQRLHNFTHNKSLEDIMDSLNTSTTTALPEFFNHINSLLNSRSGALVIHSKKHTLLEKFDHRVDNKLNDLIPNGSTFHKTFERTYSDSCHLVYRVKPVSSEGPKSTVNFNLKVSQNKGLEKPSYSQMSTLVKDLCSTRTIPSDFDSQGKIRFEDEKPVFLRKPSGHYEPFQESIRSQAKAVFPSPNTSATGAVADSCWEHLRLPEYISAFSLIEGGGSVYFGVAEKSVESDKWIACRPTTIRFAPHVQANGWRIWKAKISGQQKQNPNSVYYLAKTCKKTKTKTGEFITCAFRLHETQHEGFRRSILEKVEKKMKWVGAVKPVDPVDVSFHHVEGAQDDHFVLEVKIKYYHGLCFTDKDGPESYEVNGAPISGSSSVMLEQIQFENWVKSFIKDADEHLRELKEQLGGERRCYFCTFLLPSNEPSRTGNAGIAQASTVPMSSAPPLAAEQRPAPSQAAEQRPAPSLAAEQRPAPSQAAASMRSSELSDDKLSKQSMLARCSEKCCRTPNKPYQPRGNRVLKDICQKSMHKKKLRTYTFNDAWFDGHSWLHFCLTTKKLYCFGCMAKQTPGEMSRDRDPVFTEIGFSDWMNAEQSFVNHESSEEHKKVTLVRR